MGLQALAAQLLHGLGQQLFAQVGEHDLRTLGAQRLGEAKPRPRAAPVTRIRRPASWP